MTPDNGQPLEQRLDGFVDGLLDPPARAAFEQRLAADSALRAELERQRVVDASLRRLFPVPDAGRVAELLRLSQARSAAERESGMAGRERGPEAGEPAGSREAPAMPELREDASGSTAAETPLTLPSPRGRGEGRARRRLILYASAAAVLLMFATWVGRVWLFPPDPLPGGYTFKPMDPETAIAKIKRDQYQPDTICTDEQQFAGYAWGKTGQGLAVREPLPDGVRIVGWSMYPVLSEKTAILIAQIGNRYEFVIMDRVANDRAIGEALADGPWKARRETVGNILLYQLTTADEPALKDAFYDPKRDEDWYRKGMVW